MRFPATLSAALVFAAAAGLRSPGAALADPAPQPAINVDRTISVTAAGSVDFTPDIARVTVGVRAEEATAAAAAKSVNARAQAVVDALRKLGIPERNLKTSGYDITYQPPPPPPGASPQPMMSMSMPVPMPPGQAGFPGEMRHPMPSGGTYVASENIEVTSAVDKAGAVLDGAVAAGANETYGLSFDTSNRDSLYRQALVRAVASARAQAAALAGAAGVSIGGVQSINVGESTPRPMFATMMMGPAPRPPVLAGTDTIGATVQIVFKIK